jgi:hypothetical protein
VNVHLLAIIILTRNLRFASYLGELADFEMIYETFRRFYAPFGVILASLYTILFFFSNIGMYLYGGLITTKIPTNELDAPYMYHLLNFNDFYSSMMTLFSVLVENNWDQIVDLYCTVTGSNHPRIYFSVFFLITTMIMLNIIISVVIEAYSDIRKRVHLDRKKVNLAQ